MLKTLRFFFLFQFSKSLTVAIFNARLCTKKRLFFCIKVDNYTRLMSSKCKKESIFFANAVYCLVISRFVSFLSFTAVSARTPNPSINRPFPSSVFVPRK